MRLSIILVFVWLVFKSAMLQFGYESERIGVILNILFLVIIIFMAVRNLRKDLAFFEMLKAGMRPAAVYIILITLAIFIYYSWLDPGHMPGVIESNIDAIEQTIDDEGGYEAFAKNHGPLESADRGEYLEKQREGFQMLFSPFARASQSLLALTMLALIYSLMMIGFYKVGKRFIQE